MKKFEVPEMEIDMIRIADIISTSGQVCNIDCSPDCSDELPED